MNAKLDGEFREFMHARWPFMVRLAYGLTGDQGHAEDVAQAAFARAYASWPRVSRAWLIRMRMSGRSWSTRTGTGSASTG